jgi:methyl-CpG-binding domain protein 4
MDWIPPRSPYDLLQEQIYDDPWKIFVCCIFCNLTKRRTSEPYFWETIKRWPTPKDLANADEQELLSLIAPLGLSERRMRALKRMSDDYINLDWRDDPKCLYGIGKYASDAYQIFCAGNWQSVEPKDGALVNYHNYLKELYNVTKEENAA